VFDYNQRVVSPHTPLAQVIEQHLPTVWNFCSRMTLSMNDARESTFETFERAAASPHPPSDHKDLELWLLKIAAHVTEKRLPPTPEVDFDLLDETLRSEATRTHEVSSLTTPEREFLLWELKQGCMTAVINCLSPGERVAFVMSSVMSKSDEEAAKALGIKVSAFKVRLSRARKKIGDYLAPRCEHVNPMNPCRCPARVGTALARGFIKPVGSIGGEVSLRKPEPYGRYGTGAGNEDVPMRDISAIYGGLPDPDPPADFAAKLVEQLASAS
jgi:RNA polymerase sigma factor (sigma-70 family)